jgi:hypothetical protein
MIRKQRNLLDAKTAFLNLWGAPPKGEREHIEKKNKKTTISILN